MVYGARAEPAAPSSRCGPHPGADPAPSSEHSAAGVGRIIYFVTCTMFRLRHSGRAGKEQALISRVPCGGSSLCAHHHSCQSPALLCYLRCEASTPPMGQESCTWKFMRGSPNHIRPALPTLPCVVTSQPCPGQELGLGAAGGASTCQAHNRGEESLQ